MAYRNSYSRRSGLSSSQTILPILLVCIACWVASFRLSVGFPVYGEVSATPLWNTICEVLPGKTFTYIIGMILMFGGAFLLSRANYVLVLIRERTQLPFLFYILFISTNPDFFPLKSTSVGVFCLILAIYQLFTSYHDPSAREKAYNAALLIGIGSLLWIHLLWFLPLLWIGMYNFKTWTFRTFLASLLGVGTVYWFLLGWCVWQQDFSSFTIPFQVLFKVRFPALDTIVISEWISILAIAILTLIASFHIWIGDTENSLRSRQFLSFLIMMAAWAFGLYFLYEQVSEEFLETACVPASILIAHFFTTVRGRAVTICFYLFILLLFTTLVLRIWNFL